MRGCRKRAHLEGAGLRFADLRSGTLGGAYLKHAQLTGGYLKNADLQGANLEGANLEGANLKDAMLVDVRNLPELSAKQEEDACRSDCGSYGNGTVGAYNRQGEGRTLQPGP